MAATNVDMARAVAEGRFREDLFYRLATVSITVPPLRERGNDIQLLARKFASDFAEKNRTPQISFSDGARDRMLAYRWPGNVRQLKNVVEQMALFEAGNDIPLTLIFKSSIVINIFYGSSSVRQNRPCYLVISPNSPQKHHPFISGLAVPDRERL